MSALTPKDDCEDEPPKNSLGRHLGFKDVYLLVIGRSIGTGIFSVPSFIYAGVGSPGAALLLWALGILVSLAGLTIWLEFASMFPRSGGEKVFLDRAYPRPRLLAVSIFGMHAIVLGFTAAGCIVGASNLLIVFDVQDTLILKRSIAVGAMVLITAMHSLRPNFGVRVLNFFGMAKIGVLLLIVGAGLVSLCGGLPRERVPDPLANFRHPFAGTSMEATGWATAFLKVLNSFVGWSSPTYVLDEVRNPVRTITRAGPLALLTVGTLYLLANLAYLSVSTVDEIKHSGVTAAALFFGKVFGHGTQRALSLIIALSALSNVAVVTFAASRINQELARDGVLPWSRLLASTWPAGAPTGACLWRVELTHAAGLIVHAVPSILVIVLPPPGEAYSVIIDTEMWPLQAICFAVVIGLFVLRWRQPERKRPFRAWLSIAAAYAAVNAAILVIPWLPPQHPTGTVKHWVAPALGGGVLVAGAVYWAVAFRLMPWARGYELVPQEGRLDDGTTITEYVRQRKYEPVPTEE